MIEIKKYNPDLEQFHIDFASRHWTKSRRKIPDYIYWKFRRNNNEDLGSFLLAFKDNKVIGQLGLIPITVYIEGELYDAQWACDLMVDNEYRGCGVAKLLYDYAHSQKPLTLGSNPSPSASKSMKKNGYKAIKGSWRFIFTMNLGETFRLKSFKLPFLNYIPNFFVLFFILWAKIRNKRFDPIKKEAYFALNNYKSNNFIYSNSDDEFVKWRFAPFKSYYKGIDTFGNNLKSSYSGFYASANYYITDFNVINKRDFFDIVAQIIIQYRKQGLLAVRFFSNDDRFSNWMLFFGFIKFRTQTEIIFYTDNQNLSDKLLTKKFYYTYTDSDENI